MKKNLLYFSLLLLTIAILYFGMAWISITLFYSDKIWVIRIQGFSSMLLSGIAGYFVFKPIIFKKLKAILQFDSVMIMAIVIANIFRAAVTDFSLTYISLILAALYLVFYIEE